MSEAINIETLLADRAKQFEETADPLQTSLQQIGSDKWLTEALEQADKHGLILGHYDYGGFKVTTAVCELNTVAIYIENGKKDGSHAIITTPFTLEEWKAKEVGTC
jgi:hypothetical protein